MAKPNTPAAQPLDLTVVAAPLELEVATLIVFKGPGSWKQEARWDEYVVMLVNQGKEPVALESIELIDLLGQPRAPGDDPWKLEKLSRSNWDKYGKTGLHLVEGVGAVAIYSGAVVAASTAAELSAGAAGGGVAVLGAIPLVGLVEMSAVTVMNHHNKAQVEREFQRRRLNLPHVMAPGESLAGSLFFPMTPGPQRLVVRGHNAEQPLEVELELERLATLHIKPVTTRTESPLGPTRTGPPL